MIKAETCPECKGIGEVLEKKHFNLVPPKIVVCKNCCGTGEVYKRFPVDKGCYLYNSCSDECHNEENCTSAKCARSRGEVNG